MGALERGLYNVRFSSYRKMVEETQRGRDKQQQLLRRITDITYYFIDGAGQYQSYTIPMNEYTDYEELKVQAAEHIGAQIPLVNSFKEVTKHGELPF